MTTALPPSLPASKSASLLPGERVWPTVVMAGLLTFLGDFLFWGHTPGLAFAIFAAALATFMMFRRGREALRVRSLLPFILLIVSAGQSAVEMSFTNLFVLLTLFAVLLAELWFTVLPRGWPRWGEALVAWLCGLGRWLWLIAELNQRTIAPEGKPLRLGERLGRGLRIVFPALGLLAIFFVVFSSGNRIFGEFLGRWFRQFADWLLRFDFSIPRMLLWFFLATLALTFLRPRKPSVAVRRWARPPAEWQRSDVRVAFLQCLLILAALNALFFAVNTIDAVYLWQRTAVPAGVTTRDYLYEGVYSLIGATVLAGIVLSFLFQQSASVTESRPLKILAFAWIVQNLVLITGVFLRLKLYVDLEEMTAKRVYVACFLLLVTLGFFFLCRHVWRGREVGRLIWRCALSTFILFFVLQFLNVVGWVCRYNIERWERQPDRVGVNFAYQFTLGPGAWPTLLEAAHRLPPGDARQDLILGLRELASYEAPRRDALNWRSWQLRRDRNAEALLAWAQPLGAMTADEREAPIIRRYYETKDELRRRNR